MGRNNQLVGLILFTYLIFTIILFAYGPWPWPVDNKVLLYLFLIINSCILLLFYYIGINSSRSSRLNQNYKIWYKISLIISLVLLIPTSYFRIGTILPNITTIFNDLGEIYFESRQFRLESSAIIEYIRMLFSPFLFSLFPLTIFYWKEIGKVSKYLALIVSFIYILISINMGINKDIVEYFIILIFILLIKAISKSEFNIVILLKRTIIALMIVCIAFITLNYFQSTQEGRAGGNIELYNHRANMYADPDALLISYLPMELQGGIIALSSYMTQGYYGLSLSMKEPFTWTYGVGNSIFLMNNIESLFNLNIEENIYPFKTIKYGWDPYIKWSSLYSWLASDFTFIGVFFIMAIIGFILSLSVKDMISNSNFLAIPVFSKLLILILYIPANNQVVQTGESFFAFYILLGMWLFSRRFKLRL